MLFTFIGLIACGSSFYVMAPLDLFDSNQALKQEDTLKRWFASMKSANVDGIMIDVWWGLAETAEKEYKWSGYHTIFNMMNSAGLKIIPVMSFHKCGGNVGDECNIKLPSFVLKSSLKPFFVDNEYISFGYDNEAITERTPLEMYRDFMTAFKNEFQDLISSGVITEIEVGTGPCGELRFPGYQTSYWGYPGCGAFQSYDEKLTERLAIDAKAAGKESFGHNPTNAGDYNAKPGTVEFWQKGEDESWSTEYGRWYMSWYAKVLNDHGASVFKIAREVFGNDFHLSSKIPGIHWQYTNECHCAEATAGFNNFDDHDGYADMIAVFKQYNIDVCFSCLEMTKNEGAGSDPERLVNQILKDTLAAGLVFEGENALEVYDSGSWNRIYQWVPKGLKVFTFLRLRDYLLENDVYSSFKEFVAKMHNGNGVSSSSMPNEVADFCQKNPFFCQFFNK